MKREQDGFSMAAAQADRRKRKAFVENRKHAAHGAAAKHIEAVEKRGVTFVPVETSFDRYVIKLLKRHWLGGPVRWARVGGTVPHGDWFKTTPEQMCFALARKPS